MKAVGCLNLVVASNFTVQPTTRMDCWVNLDRCLGERISSLVRWWHQNEITYIFQLGFQIFSHPLEIPIGSAVRYSGDSRLIVPSQLVILSVG